VRVTRSKAEGEGFEPSVDRKAHNGFRDRAETTAMPHHNWSPPPGGIQGGMNLSPAVCATRIAAAWAENTSSARARSIASSSVCVQPAARCRSDGEAGVWGAAGPGSRSSSRATVSGSGAQRLACRARQDRGSQFDGSGTSRMQGAALRLRQLRAVHLRGPGSGRRHRPPRQRLGTGQRPLTGRLPRHRRQLAR
jgi:hypothetical protein